MSLLSEPEATIVAEDVFFRAGLNLLHGQLAYPEVESVQGAVVFAGPHPLLGGNMNNNVVRCLSEGLALSGYLTLRFDYRGVGRSLGATIDIAKHLAEFWKTGFAPGEMDYWQDVQAAVEYVQQAVPGLPVNLVGYSFGCALLPHVTTKNESCSLILIAPTIAKHNYDAYLAVTNSLLLIASEDDFATDADRMKEWFRTLGMPRRMLQRQCDNHFFRGHEPWLLESILQFLDHERCGL